MTENRLPDYLDHMLEAAQQACSYVEGMDKEDFLADKRTQQAVILNLVIIGEAATKLIQNHSAFLDQHAGVFSCLSDPSLFAQAFVEHGAVTWPGEIDLAPDAMYAAIKKSGAWVL